ncbi:MAG: aminoacyl-tRNA hydrolase [Proteobacteria bacterium]|nr:aminoacyl-tRNA hydrolase [Pseudomonadota bacterium]NIS71536.1 aminoacyl-tRNA hydrolase [Pseudomonadota bacterium]
MIEVTKGVSIPEVEVKFTASRSSGPGGQHVNKADSRVTLWFNVASSRSLSPAQKRRILNRLTTRVNKKGVLRVVSQKTRSQAANREVAVERFVDLLRQALRRASARKRTQPPIAVKESRLARKRRRSRLKDERSRRIRPEDWD